MLVSIAAYITVIVVNDIVPHVPRTLHGDRGVNIGHVINTRRSLRIIISLRIFIIVSSPCSNRGFTVDVIVALRA